VGDWTEEQAKHHIQPDGTRGMTTKTTLKFYEDNSQNDTYLGMTNKWPQAPHAIETSYGPIGFSHKTGNEGKLEALKDARDRLGQAQRQIAAMIADLK
jgi:hypothetical protein